MSLSENDLRMVFVLVFVAVTGSFKNMMVGQITDSFVGHLQIHKRNAFHPQYQGLSADRAETGNNVYFQSRVDLGVPLGPALVYGSAVLRQPGHSSHIQYSLFE